MSHDPGDPDPVTPPDPSLPEPDAQPDPAAPDGDIQPDQPFNLDDLIRELDEEGAESEQLHGMEKDRFGNDSFIEKLIAAADRDNLCKERGSHAMLLVYLAHGERLRLATEHGYTGDRFNEFGKRITGFKPAMLSDLIKLDHFALDILSVIVALAWGATASRKLNRR
jgi:hypothetical protein